MSKPVVAFLAAMILAAGPPAVEAAGGTTPLYPTTVEMHFTGPGGKTRTINETVYIGAGGNCAAAGDPLIYKKHPELAGMTLASITCHDSAGAGRPGGPAIVRVFLLVDGHAKVAVVDHLGTTTFDMKTCPFVLQKDQPALIAEAQKQFPTGKFFSANCMARPLYMSTYLNSLNQD